VVEYFARSAWTSAPRPVRDLVALDAGELRGIAVHYTGSTTPLGDSPTLGQTVHRLEAERVEHVEGRGWSDIAYLAAIDQAGRVFDCRGIAYRSAANGDQAVNRSHGAVTILLGVGAQPTAAALAAFRDWYQRIWLNYWPKAGRIVGHRDLHSTSCPGDPLYALIKAGTLASPPPGKDPDPMAGFTLDQLTRAISTKTMSAEADFQPHDPTPADPERTIGPAAALGEILASCRRTEVDNARIESKLDKLLAAQSGS
jgi:hypothetical protein